MKKYLKVLLVFLIVSTMLACSLPFAIPTPTVMPVPLATPTLPPPSPYSNWQTYTDQNNHFEFKYPPDAQITDQLDSSARINLSIAPNTNLSEKYLDIAVSGNVASCSSPATQGYAPGSFQSSQVTINNLPFTLENGADAGAGSIYEWTAYSTSKDVACVSLTFVMHSTNPAMYDTPPTEFDRNTESAVFAEIVSTFKWLTP